MTSELATSTLAAPEETQVSPIAGQPKKSALVSYGDRGIQLKTMEESFLFARAALDSGMAPKGFDSPQKIFIAVQLGAELGLSPMSSLQSIAVIQGRPVIWGDAVGAICSGTGLLEDYFDEQIGTPETDTYGYRVTIKRKGRSHPVVRAFTVADAKKAGLWGKQGPWGQYPDRMLLARAKTFGYRDAFPDALKGTITAEEAQELPEQTRNVTPANLDQIDAPKAKVA